MEPISRTTSKSFEKDTWAIVLYFGKKILNEHKEPNSFHSDIHIYNGKHSAFLMLTIKIIEKFELTYFKEIYPEQYLLFCE